MSIDLKNLSGKESMITNFSFPIFGLNWVSKKIALLVMLCFWLCSPASLSAQSPCDLKTWSERTIFTIGDLPVSAKYGTLELGKPYSLINLTNCYCDQSKDKTTWQVWPYRSAPVTTPKFVLTGANTHYNASVTFMVPGIYTVEMFVVVAGRDLCLSWQDVDRKDLYITIPYSTPVAKFLTDNSSAGKIIDQGDVVSFKDASTKFPTEWKWTVTPSTGVVFTSGKAESNAMALRFNQSGSYTISLKAKNEAGEDTEIKNAHIIVNPKPPVADFTANSTTSSNIRVTQDDKVVFRDNSTNIPTKWQWSFSPSAGINYFDGTDATKEDPIIGFTNIGNYNVTLVASNAGGSGTKAKSGFITVLPQPPVVVNDYYTYCQFQPASRLSASGTSLKWFTSPTSSGYSTSAPVPSTNESGKFSYYVSQTINGFESNRTPIEINVNAAPSKPGINTPLTFCVGSPSAPLTATGSNLKWYTQSTGGTGSATAPTPSTALATTVDYYVTQTNNIGCESQRAHYIVDIVSGLPLPSIISPVNYCKNAPSTALTATLTGGTSLRWYNVPSGGSVLAGPPVPGTSGSGTQNFYVSQIKSGCAESPRANVQVVVSNIPVPAAPAVTSPVVYIEEQPASPLTATALPGATLNWYTAASGGNVLPNAPTPNTAYESVTSYFVSQTANDCEGARAQILVQVNSKIPRTGPDWDWSSSIGGPALDMVYDMVKGPENSTFIVGQFVTSITIGDTVLTHGTIRPILFVAKLDSLNKPLWAAKALEIANGTASNIKIAVDRNENIVIGGTFNGIVHMSFKPGSSLGSSTLISNRSDVFIAQLDQEGWGKWVTSAAGGQGDEKMLALALDTAGKSIVTGQFNTVSGITGNTVIGGQLFPYPPLGVVRGFMVKKDLVDQVGSIWAKNLLNVMPANIWVDSSNNIFLSGTFNTTATFGTTTISQSYSDIGYLAKYNSSGESINGVRIGNNSITITGLAKDDFGNSWLLGWLKNVTTFGSLAINPAGTSNAFLMRLGRDNDINWVKIIEADVNGLITLGKLWVDAAGQLYFGGDFSGTIKFDQFSQTSIAGSRDIFGASYDQNGNVRWLQKAGNASLDIFNASCPGIKGQMLIGSQFLNTLHFGLKAIVSAGNYDVAILGIGVDTADARIVDVAPRWSWARNINVGETFTERDIAIDANGYIYKTGDFYEDLVFEDTTIELKGNYAMYIARFKPDGSLDWIRTAEGTAVTYGKFVELGPDGDLWVAGDFFGETWKWSILDNQTFYPAEGSNFFVARLSPEGEFKWVKVVQGGNMEGLSSHPEGGCVLMGNFYGAVKIGTTTLTSAGGSDIFMARILPTGEILWAKREGGTSSDFPGDLNISSSGNIYRTVLRSGDYFFNKYDAAGTKTIDNKLIGDGVTGALTVGKPSLNRLTGDFYYSGSAYYGTYNFGTIKQSLFSDRFFISKCDNEGNTLWVKFAKGDYFTSTAAGTAVVVDDEGYPHVAIRFDGTMELGNTEVKRYGRYDMAVAKFNPNGDAMWVLSAGSSDNETPIALASGIGGRLVLSGDISGDAPANFSDTAIKGQAEKANRFIAMMGPVGIPPSITHFEPAYGKPGDTVRVYGKYLSSSTQLRFNGKPSGFLETISANELVTVVPEDAVSGALVVNSANGLGKSAREFQVLPEGSGDMAICPGTTVVLSSNLSGASYQWQVDQGTGFRNLLLDESILFQGINGPKLTLLNTPASFYGHRFRCMVSGNSSNITTLKFVSYWGGIQDNNWDNLANWGCNNALPNAYTDVFIPSGTVIIRRTVSVRSIIVGPGANIIIEPGCEIEIIRVDE